MAPDHFSYVLAVTSAILVGLVNAFFRIFSYGKLVAQVAKVFQIADPILKANLPSLSKAMMYQIVEEIARSISDEDLSQKEMDKIVRLFFKLFSVEKLADAPVIESVPIENISGVIADAVQAYKKAQSVL